MSAPTVLAVHGAVTPPGRLHRAVAAADAVLFATPVYRGSMTGALKNLFDLLPVAALEGKPVVLVPRSSPFPEPSRTSPWDPRRWPRARSGAERALTRGAGNVRPKLRSA